MGKSLTYEFVKEYIESFGYKLLSEEYINNSTKLNVKCNNGHIYNVNFGNFKNGKRCPKCAKLKQAKNQKLPFEAVKCNIEKTNEYELLSNSYKNNMIPITIKHLVCGHIYTTGYRNFQQGYRCPKCAYKIVASKRRLNYDYVKEHIESFNYKLHSKSYKNSHIKLKIECDKGHIYNVKFNHFQQGSRCPICAYINISGENNPNWISNREHVYVTSKIQKIAGSLVYRCLKLSDESKTTKTENLLGYTKKDLLTHLEQFDLWNAHIKDSSIKINIDHIIPIKAFVDHGYDCENLEDIKIINHLSNLQVLTEFDNLSKKDNYSEEDFQKYITKFNLKETNK